MIEALHLTRRFGAVVAVSDVTFQVRAGEAVGFLGPNGAGKTTTFRMLTGSLGPSSGQVRIHGHDLSEEPIQAKRLFGYMPENAPLYPEMTALEYLSFKADLKGYPRKERKKLVLEAAGRAHVTDVLGTRIGHLSKGYRQRVALADAILGSPPALLLDEPTAGLDPNQVEEVRELVRELARDRAVLISTHVLSEVEATCKRAIVLSQGKIVLEGDIDQVKLSRRIGSILRVRGKRADVEAAVATGVPEGAVEIEAGPGDVLLLAVTGDEALVQRLLAALLAAEVSVLELVPRVPALKDVFQDVTGYQGG